MGSNSTKEIVEQEREVEVEQVVHISQLENNNVHRKTASEVKSFAEVHSENNADSIKELISSSPFQVLNERNKSIVPSDKNSILNKSKMKDIEVDEAIAELEETFRTLDSENSSSSASNYSSDEKSDDNSAEPPSEIVVTIQPQFPPPGGIPTTAESISSWDGLHAPSTPANVGGAKPNTGPPMRIVSQNVDKVSPRHSHLSNRSLVLTQRSHSQHGRTSSGMYSPSSQISHRFHPQRAEQSPLARLQNQSRGTSSQIIVIQQQNQRLAELLLFDPPSLSQKENSEWIYQPPKIEGFDVDKFKEVNHRKETTPISFSLRLPRDDCENEALTKSKDYHDYTQDELDLIASLEREIF